MSRLGPTGSARAGSAALAWLCATGCGLLLDSQAPGAERDAAVRHDGGPSMDAGARLDAGPPGDLDAGRPDAGDPDARVVASDAGCACPDDDDPCTRVECVEGMCSRSPMIGAACDLDDDLCTRDVCGASGCEPAGVSCPSPQVCDPTTGACSCPFDDLKICRDMCISDDSCCTDADCAAPLLCLALQCNCPSGQRECDGACIDASMCCEDAECGSGRCIGGACAAA